MMNPLTCSQQPILHFGQKAQANAHPETAVSLSQTPRDEVVLGHVHGAHCNHDEPARPGPEKTYNKAAAGKSIDTKPAARADEEHLHAVDLPKPGDHIKNPILRGLVNYFFGWFYELGKSIWLDLKAAWELGKPHDHTEGDGHDHAGHAHPH